MGLDQDPADEELHHGGGDPHVGGLADVLPRQRVEHLVDLGVDVRPYSRRRPRGQHERPGRQRPQRVLLHGLEHRRRGCALQRPARPPPRDLQRPAGRLGLHLRQRRELPAAPVAVADIRHRALDLRFIARLQRPRRVDQAAVVRGHLRIGPVDFRVVKVGLVHPGLQVVRDQPGRDAAEELERRGIALSPGALVHRQDRPHEHVPRIGQHHDERPDGAQPPRHRVQPPAQLPVIDLRLLPGLGRMRVPHRHLRPADLLRDVGIHVAAEARHAGRQAPLVPQPLVDRRHPHPGLELLGDVIVVLGDRRPRHLPQPRIGQLREPLPDQLMPLILALGRPARGDARRDRGSDVLPQRLAVYPQRPGHLGQRPARMPVHEYLRDINHVERSPCHRPPAVLIRKSHPGWA
jgi:hypothetical protein